MFRTDTGSRKNTSHIISKCTSLILLFSTLFILGLTGAPISAQAAEKSLSRINNTNISYETIPKLGIVNHDAVAIVIGNKNYKKIGKGVPDVKYAHNDADVITTFLIRSLGFREGNIITLKDALFSELVAHFGNTINAKGKVYNLVREGKSDLFIFYSGHGAPSLDSGQGFLLPVDADPEAIGFTGYALDTFYRNIEKIPARTTTVMIDACFSGDSSAGSIIQDASSIALKLTDVAPPQKTMTLLTAAGLSEIASWDHDTKTGLFTRHFIEGIGGKADKNSYGNGDGAVSLKELSKYLDGEVAYSARALYQRSQHPQVRGESDIFMAMWKAKLKDERRRVEEARKKERAKANHSADEVYIPPSF